MAGRCFPLTAMPETATPPRWPVLALLVAPYLLNDLANIFVHEPVAWLVCDYGSRVFSFACLAGLVRRGVLGRADFQLQRPVWSRAAAAALIGTAGGLVLLIGPPGRALLDAFSPTQIGAIPAIHPPWLHRVDYVGGLALVAVSEELVFRGAVPRLLLRAGVSPAVSLLVSAAAFGVAHWSLGVGSVLQTAAIGVVLGGCAQFGRGLWPVILAHYAIDLVAFG
jgi:membrane protease YdiL (CAAX protease family)